MARSRQNYTGPVKVKVPSAMRGAGLAMPAGLQPYGNGILVTTPLPAGTVICGSSICILESREDYKQLQAYKEAQSAKRAAKRSRSASEDADEAAGATADEAARYKAARAALLADSDDDEAADKAAELATRRKEMRAALFGLSDDEDEEPYTKRQATPARQPADSDDDEEPILILIEDADGNFVEVPAGAGERAECV